MIKYCQFHQWEEEKYICIHKTRLQKEDNKFSCHKCLDWKKSNNYIKSMKEVEEEAKQNIVKFVEMQTKIINSNNEMKQKYLESLTELCQKINQYFQKQQKSVTSLVEQQNQILTQNINQANSLLNEQSVLDSQSIDNFIIFTTLNEANQKIIENNYNNINKCLERQFNYEFAEIQCKVNQFTNLEFKFDSIPKYEVEQFKILTVDKEKDKLQYCKDHQMEKNCICTHEDCLKEKKKEYLCLGCSMNSHSQHFKGNFIKTVKKIKTEQNEKLKIIKEQYEMLKQEVENRIDKELTTNQQKQQENFVNSQTTRENLKQLEAQIKINPFNQKPNYTYYNIDQNLLSYDQDMIKLEFQSKLDQLEQLKQQITKQEKKSLINNTKLLKSNHQLIMQQYEIQISELQNKLEANSSESIIAEIKKSQKLLIEESLKQSQKQFIEGVNEIKQQIQTFPKVVTESKQFSSLQSDLNNVITIINKINQQSLQIPNSHQELKNSINGQEGIKQQITNLSNLNQDLKVMFKGMNEIKSSILNIPKLVLESKQFSSLQSNTTDMINRIIQLTIKVSTPQIVYQPQQILNNQQGLNEQPMGAGSFQQNQGFHYYQQNNSKR
ncbi:unnamed protein product [Paramecium primaurelia]|uniref:Uncharacterized protein n=1 Tax=Paramecium primaurelia TaxID=5886 RepID=A0A8S1N4L2_PARPR|nr:unnamed protein product [Paramecium primaurelia]